VAGRIWPAGLVFDTCALEVVHYICRIYTVNQLCPRSDTSSIESSSWNKRAGGGGKWDHHYYKILMPPAASNHFFTSSLLLLWVESRSWNGAPVTTPNNQEAFHAALEGHSCNASVHWREPQIIISPSLRHALLLLDPPRPLRFLFHSHKHTTVLIFLFTLSPPFFFFFSASFVGDALHHTPLIIVLSHSSSSYSPLWFFAAPRHSSFFFFWKPPIITCIMCENMAQNVSVIPLLSGWWFLDVKKWNVFTFFCKKKSHYIYTKWHI